MAVRSLGKLKRASCQTIDYLVQGGLEICCYNCDIEKPGRTVNLKIFIDSTYSIDNSEADNLKNIVS